MQKLRLPLMLDGGDMKAICGLHLMKVSKLLVTTIITIGVLMQAAALACLGMLFMPLHTLHPCHRSGQWLIKAITKTDRG